MAATKTTPQEYIKKKQEMAAQPGTFVIRSHTLESRWLLRNIREYDWHLSWIKAHLGIDVDTEEALALIEGCRNLEENFKSQLEKLRKFVLSYKNGNKNQSQSHGDEGRAAESKDLAGSNAAPDSE